MKFLVDEQLDPALARVLRTRGFEAAHVYELGLTGTDDLAIWRHACAHDWIVVTKDSDYADLLKRAPPHCPVLWVRLGNLRTRPLVDAIFPQWDRVVAEFQGGSMLVVIA